MSAPAAVRSMMWWCPDFPVHTARIERGLPPDAPVAVVAGGRVLACSVEARETGVIRGLRVREAEARCSGLLVVPHDETADYRVFEPLLRAVEERIPGVQLLRPGHCLLGARGPARYYGGEDAAAAAIIEASATAGFPRARVGIADGAFTAEQAARQGTPVYIVPAGASADFLAALPVHALGDPELTTVLERLGVHRLGAFANLDEEAVRDRFGPTGTAAWRRAAGADDRPLEPRTPPVEWTLSLDLEPPVERVDELAFAFRTRAEDLIARLTAAGEVATGIRIDVRDDRGTSSTRSWRHPRWFTAGEVLDRIRWQVQGSGRGAAGLEHAVAALAVVPEHLERAARHERGLWGSGPDERVHSGIARVQGLVGHTGVRVAVPRGGRMLAERIDWVPWGDAPAGGGHAAAAARAAQPWPGEIPGPAPTSVYSAPLSVHLLDEDERPVRVDERGALSASPALLRGVETRVIAAWAGPWPVIERWWSAEDHRRYRCQLVDENGAAWLLYLDGESWFLEAGYD